MTTKTDLLRDAIIEVIKTFDPEVVETKEFSWSLEDLLDTIETFESENEAALKAEQEKYETH